MSGTVGAHNELHSEQGALPGEHPGRSRNPVIKVADLAWLEFEKPDLDRAEAFARAFGFTHRLCAAATSCSCAAPIAGAPCVLLRRGARSRFVGTAFRAADEVDVLRLADATGAADEATAGIARRPVGGTRRSERRPGPRGRGHARPARAARPATHTSSTSATNSTAPTPPSARPGCRPMVQRLGHVVLQTTKYTEALNFYLDNLGMIVSDFLYYPGQRARGPVMSFIRCDRGLDAHRPPHPGARARARRPLRALRLPGVRPGCACRGR